MAAPLMRLVLFDSKVVSRRYCIVAPAILGGPTHHKLRKLQDEEKLPSFKERMREIEELKSADTVKPVDIGLPYKVNKPGWKSRLAVWKENKKNKALEQQARLRKLDISLDEVKEAYQEEMGPIHSRVVAEHYGIFRDLFDGAFFTPSLQMRIAYDYDDELVTPVHIGNVIPPLEAQTQPIVEYEADPDSLWTLLMTNPDGHLTDNNAEYIHWFVGNIPGSDVSNGEELCKYLQPFPPKGTGYHRHVFILFKQERHLDYSEDKVHQSGSLTDRTFKTVDFFRKHQDDLTPMGLKLFQSDWDESVRKVYHDTLDMREPGFEYAHKAWYIAPLRKYPHKQPFDRYYDRYRDKKDIAEEVLKLKLKRISPFKEYKYPKYPLLHMPPPTKYTPSWLKRRQALMLRRVEQFKDL